MWVVQVKAVVNYHPRLPSDSELFFWMDWVKRGTWAVQEFVYFVNATCTSIKMSIHITQNPFNDSRHCFMILMTAYLWQPECVVNCVLGSKYILSKSFCLYCSIFRFCQVKSLTGIPDGNVEYCTSILIGASAIVKTCIMFQQNQSQVLINFQHVCLLY
jgi:hypothetical protein